MGARRLDTELEKADFPMERDVNTTIKTIKSHDHRLQNFGYAAASSCTPRATIV